MGRRGKSVGVKTPKAADAVEGPGISVAEHGASAAEAYGFVGFVLTGVMYVVYLVWAYTPEDVLVRLGVTYYPDKYWALAVPCWICVLVLYGAWMYEGVNMMSVRDLGDPDLIAEEDGFIGSEADEPDLPGSIPSMRDVPVQEVNEVVFLTAGTRVRTRRVGGRR